MADDDVVIKVTSDMGNALAGIELLVDGMGDLIKSVKDVATAVENMGQKVGEQKKPIEEANAASVAYGLQLSKVFDKVSDAVKDSIKAFPNLIKHVAEAGDQMLTLSSRIGVSVEDLSELKYIAGQSGADMMGLARTVQSLSGIFAETGEKGAKMREAISGIGLSVDDLKKQDPKTAFLQIVQAIQSTVPAADQGRVAMEIFGSKFRSNTMILKEDIGSLQAKFKELGGGMTTELAKAGDEYSDNLKNIEQVQENFKNQIVGAVLPAVNGLLEAFPKLGGFALTVGESLLDLGKSLGPTIVQLWAARTAFVATATAEDVAAVSTNVLSASIKALVGPVGWIIGALGLLAGAWVLFSKSQTESEKAIESNAKAFVDQTNTLEDALKTYDELKGKLNLNTVETERLDKATRLLAQAAGLTEEAFRKDAAAADLATRALRERLLANKALMDQAAKEVTQKIAQAKADLEAVTAAQKRLEDERNKPTVAIRGEFGEEAARQKISMEEALATWKKQEAQIAELNITIGKLNTEYAILTGTEEKVAVTTATTSTGFKKLADDLAKLHEIIKGLDDAQKAQIKTFIAANDKSEDIAKALFADMTAAQQAKTSVEELTKAIDLFKTESKAAADAADKTALAKFGKTVEELKTGIETASKAGWSAQRVVDEFGKKAFEAVNNVNAGLVKMPALVKAIGDAFGAQDITKKISDFGKVFQGGLFDALKNTPQISADQLFGGMTAALDHIKSLQTELRRATMDDHEKRLDILKEQEVAEVKAAEARVGVLKDEKDQEIALIHAKYDDQRAVENKATGDFERDMKLRGIKTKAVLKQEMVDTKKALDEILANRESAGEGVVAAAQDAANRTVLAWAAANDDLATLALAEEAADQKARDDRLKKTSALLKAITRIEGQFSKAYIREVRLREEEEKKAAGKIALTWQETADLGSQSVKGIASFFGGPEWDRIIGAMDRGQRAGADFGKAWNLAADAFAKHDWKSAGVAVAAGINAGLAGIGAMKQATSGVDLAQQVFGGALTGAQIGVSIGTMIAPGIGTGIGLAAGTIAGGLYGAFTNRDARAAQNQLGYDFGRQISDGMALAIQDRMGPTSNTARAIALMLGDIIKDVGGVTKWNFEAFNQAFLKNIELLRDKTQAAPKQSLFGGAMDVYADGKISLEQLLKTADEVFPELAAQAERTGGIWSKSFQEVITKLKATGAEVQSLTDLMDREMGRAAAGLEKVVGSLAAKVAKPLQDVRDLTKQSEDLVKERSDLLAEVGGDLSKLTENQREDLTKLDAKITETSGKIAGISSQAVAANQEEFDRLARVSLSTFNGMIAQGKNVMEAIQAIAPTMNILSTSAHELGFAGSDAFNKLDNWNTLATKNAPLLESIGGLNELMTGLANIGALDQKTFDDLMNQGRLSFDSLKEAGFETNEALAVMAPELETIRKLHKENGLELDANTKEYIRMAEASGALKDEEMSTNQVLMDGLGALITAVGGTLPDSFKKMAKASQDAAKTTTGEMAKVDKAAGNVQSSLASTDWEGWASSAVSAAQDAQAAVDGVSFGTSPGGIKEIPLKLKEAIRAFEQFERMAVDSATSVKDAVDAVSPDAVSKAVYDAGESDAAQRDMAIQRQAAVWDQARQADQASSVDAVRAAAEAMQPNFEFHVTTINSDGMKQAVEKDILPRIIDALDRNNRGSQTKLRQIIG